MMQITTIIPTYRRPQLLRRAIQSVLNQTYPDFQVCVYDNASGDETAEVVAEFAKKDSRVKYHCHAENIGAVANFNYGMAQVDTPYFSFLSDDDIVLPDFYATTLAGFTLHPDAIFSAGEVIEMTEQGEVVKAPLHTWSREGYFTPPEGLLEMIRVKPPILTGILFRRELIEQFGFFDDNIDINDYDLELRVGARFPFIVNRKLCGIFVLQTTSYSVNKGTSFLYHGYPQTLAKLKNDTRISTAVREQGSQELTAWLKRLTFRSGLFLVSTKDFEEVGKIAELLASQYQLYTKGRFLRLLVWLGKHFGFLSQLLALIYAFRKAKAKQRNQHLQDDFGNVSSYLSSIVMQLENKQ